MATVAVTTSRPGIWRRIAVGNAAYINAVAEALVAQGEHVLVLHHPYMTA